MLSRIPVLLEVAFQYFSHYQTHIIYLQNIDLQNIYLQNVICRIRVYKLDFLRNTSVVLKLLV